MASYLRPARYGRVDHLSSGFRVRRTDCQAVREDGQTWTRLTSRSQTTDSLRHINCRQCRRSARRAIQSRLHRKDVCVVERSQENPDTGCGLRSQSSSVKDGEVEWELTGSRRNFRFMIRAAIRTARSSQIGVTTGSLLSYPRPLPLAPYPLPLTPYPLPLTPYRTLCLCSPSPSMPRRTCLPGRR